MRVLVGHNAYQNFGGEDAVAASETRLLRERGHDVHEYNRSNAELNRLSLKDKTRYLWYLGWNEESYQQVRTLIRNVRPEVAHFHNIYFMMSPAVYHACRAEGVPVVQSLHNFRPLCANGLLFRNNHVCEDCLSGSLMPAVLHRCSQNSPIISAMVVRMLRSHRKMKTWHEKVNVYITATEFTRQKYAGSGFDADRIFVKPNFVEDLGDVPAQDRGYALYVGRLSDEKGVDVMIRAWKDLTDIPLKIAGDGPGRLYLSGYIQRHAIKHVTLLGHVDDEKYRELMGGARYLVLPSICYENFPRIAVEALAYGLPVLASRLGSLEEVIHHDENGMLFEPGKEEALAAAAKTLYQSSDLPRMRTAARQKYADEYSPDRNYEQLLAIYERALHTA